MADKCKRTAPTVAVVESSPSSSSSSSSSSTVVSKRRRMACVAAACQFELRDVEVEDSCHSFKVSREMRSASPLDSPGEVSSVSCCSGNEEARKVVHESSSELDLEAKGFNTKDATYAKLKSFSAFNDVSGDTDEVQLLKKSSPALTNYRRNIFPTVKTPPQDEIEEFFSVAEKYEQKRFAEKYNYDIVKDAPLEGGRYQWVRF